MDSSILIMILIGVSVAAVVVMATWLRGRSTVLAVDSRLMEKNEPILSNPPANSLDEGIIAIDDKYLDDAELHSNVDSVSRIGGGETGYGDTAMGLDPAPELDAESFEDTSFQAKPEVDSFASAKPLPLYSDANKALDNDSLKEQITTQLLGDSDCELFAERDLFSLLVFSPEKDNSLNGTQINEILDFIRSRHVDHRLALGALDIHHLSQRRKDGSFNIISYSLRNAIEPWSLDNDNLSNQEFSTPGLVFFMSVSLSDQPVVDFELMWEDASEIAKNYGLVVADDELGNPLSRQQINATRQLIAEKDLQKRIEREEAQWQKRRQRHLAQDLESGF